MENGVIRRGEIWCSYFDYQIFGNRKLSKSKILPNFMILNSNRLGRGGAILILISRVNNIDYIFTEIRFEKRSSLGTVSILFIEGSMADSWLPLPLTYRVKYLISISVCLPCFWNSESVDLILHESFMKIFGKLIVGMKNFKT